MTCERWKGYYIMTEFKRNVLLKKRREEMGMTRENLSDGICDVSTLYRFESGQIELKDSTIQELQGKMDRHGGLYVLSTNEALFIDEEDYYLYERCLHGNEFKKAREIVENENVLQLEDGIEKRQFLGRVKLYVSSETEMDCKDKLVIAEMLLKESVPEYDDGSFPMYRIYNYTELSLLNDIAILNWECGDKEKSFSVYKRLIEYFENTLYNRENRIYNKILINYSNYLGLSGEYQKSIDIILFAIRWLEKNSSQYLMYNYVFNIGWNLYQLYMENGKREYYEMAKKVVYESYCLCKMFDVPDCRIDVIKQFYEETFCIRV